MSPALLDALLATIPALLLATVTWRVAWPRWKLAAKLLLHPCLYFALALLIGHWSVLVAWLHQGLGLAGHIWFSRKHGFTWYAIEDPERYVELSKSMVASLGAQDDAP
jgi:hypothetical protein